MPPHVAALLAEAEAPTPATRLPTSRSAMLADPYDASAAAYGLADAAGPQSPAEAVPAADPRAFGEVRRDLGARRTRSPIDELALLDEAAGWTDPAAGGVDEPFGTRRMPSAAPLHEPLDRASVPGAALPDKPFGARSGPVAAPADEPFGSRSMPGAALPDGRRGTRIRSTTDELTFVGVVAPASLLTAAGGGIAAWTRKRLRVGTAVVATTELAVGSRPAAPKAAALAKRLAGRGFDASAAVGLCHVALPAEPLAFVAEARRLRASTPPDVPVVVAVGARTTEGDELLGVTDRVVLALPNGADADLAALARDSLERLGPPAAEVVVPTDPLGRRAAAAGLRPLAPRYEARW